MRVAIGAKPLYDVVAGAKNPKMLCLDPSTLRVKTAGRTGQGRRRYRVERLGRALITGTRAEVYRWLRPRLENPDQMAEMFRRTA